MTTLSDPRADPHGFDEFAAVVEDDLLRAAWLLTGDRVRATEVTEAALGQVLAGWSRRRDDRPVHQAYAALLEAIDNRPAAPADPSSAEADPSDQLARRRRATERAFALLPSRDRNAVVLHRYSNLSSRRTADLLHMSSTQVEQRSDAALAVLREQSTDLAELPFDRVPTPSAGVDRERVVQHAQTEHRVSRRRMLRWSAATGVLAAAGVGTWWVRRPYVGDATLAESLRPTRARATGQMFAWLQGRDSAPFGTGTVMTGIYNGDKPPAALRLSRSGSTLQATIDGRPVRLGRSAWGDYTAALEPLQYDEGPPIPVTLVVASVPSDTDVCWASTPDFIFEQSEPSGIELRDHSTYGATAVIGASEEIAGVVWRTASQQVGVNTGERAFLASHDELLLFLLPKAGLWGAITAEQWMNGRALGTTWMDTQLGDQGWAFLGLLPDGAHDVVVPTSPRYPDAEAAVVPIDGTSRSIVVARSRRDLVPADGEIPGVVDLLRWVGADGRPGQWKRPKSTDAADTGSVSRAVIAMPNARRTRRNAGPI